MIVENEQRLVPVELRFRRLEPRAKVCGRVLTAAKPDQHVHRHMQFGVRRGAIPLLQRRSVWQVGLADQHTIAGIAIDQLAHALHHAVHLGQIIDIVRFDRGIAIGVGAAGLCFVAQLRILEQRRDGVQPEPRYAAIEPETQHPEHRLLDRRIAPVEIGLLLVEAMVIELLARRHPGPGRAAEDRYPIVRRHTAIVLIFLLKRRDARRVGGQAVVPDVPIRFRVRPRTRRLLEPLVLVRSVVEHHVEDQLDAALLRLGLQPIEIGHRAVLRIDRLVIGDIVTKIDLRRGEHRGQPDGSDAEFLQIIEVRSDSVQIADAVSIRIGETARIDLVDYRMLPPGVRRGRRSLRSDRGDGNREGGEQMTKVHDVVMPP